MVCRHGIHVPEQLRFVVAAHQANVYGSVLSAGFVGLGNGSACVALVIPDAPAADNSS